MERSQSTVRAEAYAGSYSQQPQQPQPIHPGQQAYMFERQDSQSNMTHHGYNFDMKEKQKFTAMDSQITSTATSINDGKEGHNLDAGPMLEAARHSHMSGLGHGHDHIDINDPNRPKLPLKQRMKHFTWAWYTFPMSTGGLSLLIFAQPHQFPGLREIGFFVYIVNLIIFTCITLAMLTRFVLHRGTFGQSISHEREGFFLPTFFLSIATIITSTQRYVIPENDVALTWAIQTVFWGYVVVTLCVAVGQYSYVFAAHNFGLQTMMPTWILPIFPIMLSGTIASVIADTQPDANAIPIVVAGMTCQGLGISVSFMMYAHMVGRLMSAGLPNREHRPGLFMNVGPPAFTALAFIGMANGLPNNFDPQMDGLIDASIIRTLAIIAAVFLWALALWWFFIAVIAVISSRPKYFHLGFWAMVFPNTGFILATISISNELKSEAVKWVATGMSICLVLMYFFVLYSLIRAVWVQDIMYPGRDEDFNDH